ncbi:plectin-like [Amphibalanus amphitrite]|uniref:plectin-like n=1 Tax=Amphibalanus amphitrite TaxID=1232801 RepID=UPI001C91B220|nr:plectin-like [Amphibalanus amphitrite]
MSWRRSSRLCASTASLTSSDTSSLCQLVRRERQLASDASTSLTQRLAEADRLRTERVLAVRHAACLVTAIRAALPHRQAAEQQRRQALLNSPLAAELCAEEDQLRDARRREESARLRDWHRRLAGGEAGGLAAVRAEQGAVLAELNTEQARLEQEVSRAAVAACDPALELPTGVPADWRWLTLLDTETQQEVSDNCAVVDCAYMARLAAGWSRHGFCGGPADLTVPRLAAALAAVQFQPEDAVSCWAAVERAYPPQTPGREELVNDLMKDVLGRQLEAQVLGWLQVNCQRQEAQREHAETLRRGRELRQQVNAWRERAMSEERRRVAAAEQQAVDARQQQEAVRLREQARRSAERQRITLFQERRREREQQLRETEAQRHAALRNWRRAEAAHNQRRVELRSGLREERLRAEQQRRQLAAEQEAQRQSRLDALRCEVRVEAERDPDRLLAETLATRARHEGPAPPPPPAHAANHSFWDSQLTSDRRLRLENRLREAGLLDSCYASEVLRAVGGPPRPHLRPEHDWSAAGDR